MSAVDQVITVTCKEIREIVTNRGLAFSGIFFAGWFSVMTGLGIADGDIAGRAQLDNSLFYMGALIGLFVGYIYSGQTYLREKQSGIVETLLCAPISLRRLWIGKAIGVAVPSTMLSWLSALSIILIANHRVGGEMMPSAQVSVYILAVLPIFIVAAIALIGFGQLMLGMRENMIVNMATIMILFGALAATRLIVEEADFVTWGAVGGIATASVILLLLISFLGRYLSRERIVRTIS